MLSPNKKVWSLSFTIEVFSSQGMSPMTSSRPCKNNSKQLWYCKTNRKHWKTNCFHKVMSYFKTKKCIIRSVLNDQFSNHAITYICNKDTFILYLWSLCWRVFWKFLVFFVFFRKKLCFKIREINKHNQTKLFLFL